MSFRELETLCRALAGAAARRETNLEYEDIYQQACLAALEAKQDCPDLTAPEAAVRVRGAISEFCADYRSSCMRLPRSVWRQLSRVKAAKDRLPRGSEEELAREAGVSVRQLLFLSSLGEAEWQEPASDCDPLQQLIRKEETERLIRALRRLSPAQRGNLASPLPHRRKRALAALSADRELARF